MPLSEKSFEMLIFMSAVLYFLSCNTNVWSRDVYLHANSCGSALFVFMVPVVPQARGRRDNNQDRRRDMIALPLTANRMRKRVDDNNYG